VTLGYGIYSYNYSLSIDEEFKLGESCAYRITSDKWYPVFDYEIIKKDYLQEFDISFAADGLVRLLDTTWTSAWNGTLSTNHPSKYHQ